MKTIKFISIFTLFISGLVSCQTIIDLDARNGLRINGAYYKDTSNKLNQFEGTWVYDDGTNYIKLILVKKMHEPIGNYYEDYIIGEFQYKYNAFEMIDTLSNLNTNFNDIRHHNIWGNRFYYNHTPFEQYTNDNFRINLALKEQECLSELDIRTLNLNGQQAIQIYKWKSLETTFSLCYPIIPEGFYYLIKQ